MWRLAVVSIIVWARTSPDWRDKRPFGPSQRFAPFSLTTERLEYQTLLSLRGLKALWVSWS